MVTTTQAPDPQKPQAPAEERFTYPEPLENGDQLSATEFMRRYESMPEVKKAELIQGIVYMASPVRIDQHGDPDSAAQGWMWSYASPTPGVKSSTNATVKLGPKDVPQPDGMLRLLKHYGGQSEEVDGYLVGAPELAFEISASSVSIDSHAKKETYLRARVQEYLVWNTREGKIDWWILEEDEYRPLPLGEDGILRSRVFPGLWLDPQAMANEDGARVLEVLQLGLASEAYAEFQKTLQAK